jgi:hypothetical protein
MKAFFAELLDLILPWRQTIRRLEAQLHAQSQELQHVMNVMHKPYSVRMEDEAFKKHAHLLAWVSTGLAGRIGDKPREVRVKMIVSAKGSALTVHDFKVATDVPGRAR